MKNERNDFIQTHLSRPQPEGIQSNCQQPFFSVPISFFGVHRVLDHAPLRQSYSRAPFLNVFPKVDPRVNPELFKVLYQPRNACFCLATVFLLINFVLISFRCYSICHNFVSHYGSKYKKKHKWNDWMVFYVTGEHQCFEKSFVIQWCFTSDISSCNILGLTPHFSLAEIPQEWKFSTL